MADAKIINYGQQISAGSTAIPDNTVEALDISSTDAKDYVKISTDDGSEKLTLSGGGHGVQILDAGSVQCTRSGGWALLTATPSATVPNFNPVAGDPDTGIGRADADQLSLIAGGAEKIRATVGHTKITGKGGTTGYDPGIGAGHEATLFLENSTANSANRCALVMNTDDLGSNATTNIDMMYKDDLKLRLIAQDTTQSITFEDDLQIKNEATDAAVLTIANAGVSAIGGFSTTLTGKMGTGGASSTTVTGGTGGDATNFATQLHVGSAIKLTDASSGAVSLRTVVAIDSASTPQTLTIDTAATVAAGSSGKTDGGELFAVKNGDSKSILSVNATGVLGLSTRPEPGNSSSGNNLGIGDANMFDAVTSALRTTIIGNCRDNKAYSFVNGDSTTLIGFEAGRAFTNASRTVAIGASAADTATGTDDAVIIGCEAGQSAGDNTVYIGAFAGKLAAGVYSVGIGREALENGGGSYNTAVGAFSLEDTEAAGTHNTAIGYSTGNDATSNDDMVLIGSGAQPSATSGITNEIVIGKSAAGQGSNTIMLGNSSISTGSGLHCYDTSITSPSDLRIKNNVQDSGLGLDFINALRPVKYQKKHPSEFPEDIREKRWADQEVTRTRTNEEGETEEYTETIPADIKPVDWQPKTEYGLIAQEVKAAMEAQGGADWQGHNVLPSGMEALGYGNLVTVLVKAVQELTARVAELEAGD